LRGSTLDARNDVVLSRLALEERAGDPLAGDLGVPLTVALALMKDVRGDIHLSLPIHGDFAAQRYRLGSFVADALRRALVGAVSSPVRLLGSLFRRDEAPRFDLKPVPFEPGTAALGSEGSARIEQIARLLARQPGLRARLIAAPSRADVARLAEREGGVTPERIAALGDARSAAVAEALVTTHGIASARVEPASAVAEVPDVDAPPGVDVQLRAQ
jgi:hypothetical protein